jgi:hypothetical protein
LEWFGHVVRMGGRRTVKLLEHKPGWGRRKGRPTLRWTDDTEPDPRNTVIKINREGFWTEHNGHIMRKAKAKLNGPKCKSKEKDKEISI